MTYEQFLDEILALRRYLQSAREIMRTGFLPNLQGFDERIALLCRQIQEEDATIQERCLPELTTLLVELDVCGKDMKAWHAAALGAAAERSKDNRHDDS